MGILTYRVWVNCIALWFRRRFRDFFIHVLLLVYRQRPKSLVSLTAILVV